MELCWPQIELPRPEWLAALLVLPWLIGYSRRSLAGLSARRQAAMLLCRSLVVVALVLALCALQTVKSTTRQFVVFALDQSRSISEGSRRAADAFLDEALKAVGDNRAAFLRFASQPGPLSRGRSDEPVELDVDGTNLASAIRVAAAAIPPGYVPRVVLLADGNQTAGDALEAVRDLRTPVSTVPIESHSRPEVYVSAVPSKGQVPLGEAFYVDVAVCSDHEDEGTVQLFLGERLADEQRVKVSPGENHVRFVQSIRDQRLATFTARIDGFRDTLVENNTAAVPVFTRARPRVMLVESEARLARQFATALEDEQIDVHVRRPEDLPRSATELEDYELVALSNVPAAAIREHMEAIRSYVRDSGGGLIVIGGDQAFTPGGYHQTVLEEILPVWCVAEEQEQRPTLAMVLAIDRSSSMRGEAIELAKEATRKAVRMLAPTDQVGVLAFEDRSRWVVSIQPCGDKQTVMAQIDTITAGGGTDLYSALQKAYLALNEAFAELKHVIVLTDGASHPGDFEALATEIAESGITVSTVAVGGEALAGLLEDIARIGRGHYYYCDDPAAVPEVFAVETAAAGKPGIVERPFFVQPVESSFPPAELDVREAPSLLGYVQTKAKPTSQTVLASEQGDPLLIWWRYGLGITVAFTSDVQSRWAAAWLRWQGFGPFWSSLVRHAMRKDQARDFVLHVARQDQRVEVTLDAIDPEGNYVNGAEAVLSLIVPGGDLRRLAADQVAPGRYAAHFDAPGPGTYYLELRVRHEGRLVYVERRGLAVSYADELRSKPTNHELLEEIAEITGGTYSPKPAEVFREPDTRVPRTTPLWPGLLAAAAVLLVVDVAIRRLVRTRCARGLTRGTLL